MESNVNIAPREPWNRGKIVGQKARRSRSRTSGRFEFAFKWKAACASSHCSTWESTASCAVGASSASKSETCALRPDFSVGAASHAHGKVALTLAESAHEAVVSQ